MNRFICTLCILMIATLPPVMAQEEELGTEAPDPGSSVPVDGGLSLLLAAGAAYGGRRLHRQGAKKR